MRKSLKGAIAACGVTVPLVLGVAYTAGASVGDITGLISHNEDQWIMNEGDSGDYTLDREEIDGIVTLEVIGPDGEVVGPDDYPAFVQEAVAEFGSSDWVPADLGVFAIIDGVPCYHAGIATEAADGDSNYDVTQSGDDGTFVLEATDDGFDTAYFQAALSDDEVNALRGQSLSQAPGAEELNPCP